VTPERFEADALELVFEAWECYRAGRALPRQMREAYIYGLVAGLWLSKCHRPEEHTQAEHVEGLVRQAWAFYRNGTPH